MINRIPLISFLSAAIISCGSSGSHAQQSSDSITIPVDSTPICVIIPWLPDTAMPSVSKIRPITKVLDTVTPAEIRNLNDPYIKSNGVLTFRANQRRDADMHGTVKGIPKEISIDWTFSTETDQRETGFGRWGGGTGWTGQPLYVEWPDSSLRKFAMHTTPGFSGREIMVGSLAAKVYFIDYLTGKPSRQPIDVGNPIKGTISLDPSLNGNLYVGHGVPAQRPFGALVIDLYRHKVSDIYPEDARALRRWNAYDSSPVRVGDFVFRPGENGILYKYKSVGQDFSLHSTMTYTTASTGMAPGIEASMSVYRNYGYTADNHGYVVCTNLDTMRPVWVYASGDDNDATPVLAIEGDRPYIYCSSEIDRQGEGTALFAKLDGLTGEPVWESRFEGRRYDSPDGKHFDGGFYSSPLPGTGNCSHLIFSNLVRNTHGQNGSFVAIDRNTGDIIYETPLRVYAWSSPVGYLNEEGHMYVLTADCGGNIYLIDGIDGNIICRRPVGANFESSPVVIDNTAVVGSRGQIIYKLSIL
ncbi:MAG: dehydrogenase [Odoribacter sp.]|nr:dehydrogenase [Odoribacter sp.]